MMVFRKNYLLVLAIGLPILMMIIVVLVIRYNPINLHPQYDFLYMMRDNRNYDCLNVLQSTLFPNQTINQNKNMKMTPEQIQRCTNVTLYVYHFSTNTS